MALYNIYKKQHEKEYGPRPVLTYVGETWDNLELWDNQPQYPAKIYNTAIYNSDGNIYEIDAECNLYRVEDIKAYIKWQPPIPYTLW